jgi:hypothetical protein
MDCPLQYSRFNCHVNYRRSGFKKEKIMYLVVIAWAYVVVLMSLAEALSPQGTVLGALITLVLYGVLPLSIVIYIMGTPSRKRALAQAEAQAGKTSGLQPDESGHTPGRAENATVTPVGKEH